MGCWGVGNYDKDSVTDRIFNFASKNCKEFNLSKDEIYQEILSLVKINYDKTTTLSESEVFKNFQIKLSEKSIKLLEEFDIKQIKKIEVDWKVHVNNQFNIQNLCEDFQIFIDLINEQQKIGNLKNQQDVLFCLFLYQGHQLDYELKTFRDELKDERKNVIYDFINRVNSNLTINSTDYKEVLKEAISYINYLKSKEVMIDNKSLILLSSLLDKDTLPRKIKI